MERTRSATRWILVLRAATAVQAVLVIAFGPVGTALASTSPPLYALAAWVSLLATSTLCQFELRPGMITAAALGAAALASPFSTLGLLLIPFLGIQALVMELATHLARRLSPWARALTVNIAGQTVAFFMSLVVFEPENLVPLMIAPVALARLGGALILTVVSTYIAGRLRAAGLERFIEGRA